MLSLVKMGFMGTLTEKGWNARINVWLRAPGCTLCTYFIFAAYRHSTAATYGWALPGLLMFLIATNGQYYMQKVVGNTFRRDENFNC